MDKPEVKKVLLIEDDFAIADLYKWVLSQNGFEVKVAYDGFNGLVAAQEKPDIILLDIMLPKMNGIEVLGKLKELDATKSIPVVLLTNLGQEEIIKKAYDIGAQGYLLKMKINPYDLVKFVSKFLGDPNYKMEFNSLNLD